ncbi:MAG: hypothetical protein AAGC68_09660 [Verrucomicrobiota bacterium]
MESLFVFAACCFARNSKSLLQFPELLFEAGNKGGVGDRVVRSMIREITLPRVRPGRTENVLLENLNGPGALARAGLEAFTAADARDMQVYRRSGGGAFGFSHSRGMGRFIA